MTKKPKDMNKYSENDKLSEYELLTHLKDLKVLAYSDSGAMWHRGWSEDDEQAYQQIVELIKKPERRENESQ